MRVAALFTVLLTASCVHQEPPGNASLSVTAYNIYVDFEGDGWAKRNAAFHAFLDNSSADIIALQEVSEVQMADISQSHLGYGYVVGERSDGHRGDQGWYEFTPIMFARERFRLLDQGSFWVSEAPSLPGSILPGTKTHSRVLTWCILEDRLGGDDVLIASVHIHGARADEQIAIILDELDQIPHVGAVILAGDFNMTPDSSGYHFITQGFDDARRHADQVVGPSRTSITGDEYTYNSGDRLKTAGAPKQIDYIFSCGVAAVDRFHTHLNPIGGNAVVSDHFALTAKLSGLARCSAFDSSSF